MSLESGQSLLHYRVAEKIGEGGMGEVWRAVDTTLDREVAIKALPEVLSESADRLARFEREARLLASLNHPNIAGIYGIHQDAGRTFIAMELVDGEDLQQRMARGALKRDEALKIALQIAEALEAAHESGVIHRDLKPGNVKLTAGGKAKVLDFGLAKALSTTSSGEVNPSMSPTITSAGSVAGMILGTAAYMSPEQAKGKEVDRRADIWSFGVVLFEMLSGRRLFEEESISETLAAVIMREVDWDALPRDTPRAVRRLLQRCLQRDPHERLRDVGEARIAIHEAQTSPEEELDTAAPAAAPRSAWLAAAPSLVAVAALAALGWAMWGRESNSPRSPVMRFTMQTAEEQPVKDTPYPPLAISPDGTKIAYVGRDGGETVIFLRQIHQHEATALKGTEGADVPFFSPDGEWIGFSAGRKLKKISTLGGPPTTLCDARQHHGASWGADGTIVYSPRHSSGLMRVSEAGGDASPLTLKEKGKGFSGPAHRWPDHLPGDQTVIFTASGRDGPSIVALSLEDGSQTTLVADGAYGRFVPPGFLVYLREQTLFAARFDPRRLEVTSSAVPVLEGVRSVAIDASAHFAFSENGTLVYFEGAGVGVEESLVWIDASGNETPASANADDYDAAAVSPDGTRVALQVQDLETNTEDIWILELERDSARRLTFDEKSDTGPVWTPDGEWIVFSSLRDGDVPNLYRKRADGTGDVERLTTSVNLQWPKSWSPDGSVLAFIEFKEETMGDIMLYRPGAEPEVETYLATPFWEGEPSISPDGQFLAYSSAESGRRELYVRPLAGVGGQVRVSKDGGWTGLWRPDGRTLLYRAPDGAILELTYTVENGQFRPGLPETLLDLPRQTYEVVGDLSADGERLLVIKNPVSENSKRNDPSVVVNWTDELEAKVPRTR